MTPHRIAVILNLLASWNLFIPSMGASDRGPLTDLLTSGLNVTTGQRCLTVSVLKQSKIEQKITSEMLPYDSVAAKNILPVLGRFEALEESKTKIKVVKLLISRMPCQGQKTFSSIMIKKCCRSTLPTRGNWKNALENVQ